MNIIIYTPDEEISLKKELKDLIDNHPKAYATKLKCDKGKHLLDYINFKTPKLDDPYYLISTKVYWVLNDLSDFPKCQHCGKALKQNCKNHKCATFCSTGCVTRSDITKNKCIATFLEKYGVEHAAQTTECKEKAKQTCLEKYGVEHAMQSEKVKEKSKQTCLEKYGVEHATQSEKVKEKSKQTCLARYGVENPWQNHKIRRKFQKRYTYNNITFDSIPELALYIYLKDHGVDFEYQPKAEFWYTHNNKKHKYMPDFKIGDEYVEIKGSHLVDIKTEKWRNPWNVKLNPLCEAKHHCCLNNNVKILYETDFMPYVDYITEKYGKTYLHQFKNKGVTTMPS